jgi:hypothetical protein
MSTAFSKTFEIIYNNVEDAPNKSRNYHQLIMVLNDIIIIESEKRNHIKKKLE